LSKETEVRSENPQPDVSSLIEFLEEDVDDEEASVRLVLANNHDDEQYAIQANVNGLRQFAAALLRLDQLDETSNSGVDESVTSLSWQEDSFYITSIERTTGKEPDSTSGPSTVVGKIAGLGCVVLAVSSWWFPFLSFG
jgi:hypothetical protein